jgi:hypothetical protein
MKLQTTILTMIVMSSVLGLLSACTPHSASDSSDSSAAGAGTGTTGSSGGDANSPVSSHLNYALSLFPRETTVCDPLGGAVTYNAVGEAYGLYGQLYVLPAALDGKLNKVADYIAQGINTQTDVFLNSINVPTRRFTEGFPVADGTLVSYNGQPLLEWFAMDFHSAIQLGPNDAAGDYQIAVLADDGAALYIQDSSTNSMKEIIADDGTHPTTMRCATQPLTLNEYSQIPIELQYFQGPRYHISLMMMWRPFPKLSSMVNDPLCGASGNYEFFNPDTVPSTPQKNYTDLLARGWIPMAPENLVMPGGMNPCNVPNYQNF